MKKLAYLILILILAACNRSPKDDGTAPAPIFPQPQSIEAKPEGGYIVNPVSGDTIKPIILESGDTLQTGVPIPATGKAINPDTVAQPKVVPYSPSDSTYNAHPNRHKVPENLTEIYVNKDSLTTILLEEISQTIREGKAYPITENQIIQQLKILETSSI